MGKGQSLSVYMSGLQYGVGGKLTTRLSTTPVNSSGAVRLHLKDWPVGKVKSSVSSALEA